MLNTRPRTNLLTQINTQFWGLQLTHLFFFRAPYTLGLGILTPGTVWGWALWGWALQGHSGVGTPGTLQAHSGVGTLGWALQAHSRHTGRGEELSLKSNTPTGGEEHPTLFQTEK